jgi:hypothetical protein
VPDGSAHVHPRTARQRDDAWVARGGYHRFIGWMPRIAAPLERRTVVSPARSSPLLELPSVAIREEQRGGGR